MRKGLRRSEDRAGRGGEPGKERATGARGHTCDVTVRSMEFGVEGKNELAPRAGARLGFAPLTGPVKAISRHVESRSNSPR